MSETSHLNLKWTVADTDLVHDFARAGKSAAWIADQFGATIPEILNICADAKVKVLALHTAGARR